MHMLWEMTAWLDRYVKNAGPRRPSPGPEVGACLPPQTLAK